MLCLESPTLAFAQPRAAHKAVGVTDLVLFYGYLIADIYKLLLNYDKSCYKYKLWSHCFPAVNYIKYLYKYILNRP